MNDLGLLDSQNRRPVTYSCAGLARSLLAAVLAGCAAIPEFPASGVVAGHEFRGPVDSALAQAFLVGAELPRELEGLRQRVREREERPSSADLAEWSRRYSPDVATLLLVEAVSADPRQAHASELYRRELEVLRRVGVPTPLPEDRQDVGVLFVPGWFYRSHGTETGSDFALQRAAIESLGIRTRFVPVDENGSVEENARAVAAAVRSVADHEGRWIVVSASKSSPEVALALGSLLDARECAHVAAWLNIGGALRGSPLADRALRASRRWWVWLLFRFEGFDLDGLAGLRTESRRRCLESLEFPAHLTRVSYVGVPLSGNVSDLGRRGYRYLRTLAPNDGLVLLADAFLDGDHVLLEPGADHFFGHEEQQRRSRALLRTVLTLVREDEGGTAR
ncbi:MAG: hypothetical protein H6831_16080 [Planctomycetes bacterium]|nr:hypothetical protein [Planctomycetota bacterium]MCB9905919.1 hypothetical protein [Planctomycetota bacterium]